MGAAANVTTIKGLAAMSLEILIQTACTMLEVTSEDSVQAMIRYGQDTTSHEWNVPHRSSRCFATVVVASVGQHRSGLKAKVSEVLVALVRVRHTTSKRK